MICWLISLVVGDACLPVVLLEADEFLDEIVLGASRALGVR